MLILIARIFLSLSHRHGTTLLSPYFGISGEKEIHHMFFFLLCPWRCIAFLYKSSAEFGTSDFWVAYLTDDRYLGCTF